MTLLACVGLVLGFQILVASPFIMGETSIADYIHRSKLTGAGRNGIHYAAAFWDYCAAHRSLSIFYTWWPEEDYFIKERFSDIVKRAMLLTNIYHFFVKQNCIYQCFENLFRTFDATLKLGVHTLEQRR